MVDIVHRTAPFDVEAFLQEGYQFYVATHGPSVRPDWYQFEDGHFHHRVHTPGYIIVFRTTQKFRWWSIYLIMIRGVCSRLWQRAPLKSRRTASSVLSECW